LTLQVRTGRPMRRLKTAAKPTGRGVIREMVSISARPAEAEDRTVPGRCEGDRVVGTRPSAIAALVERTSRFTAIVALPDGIKAEQAAPHPAPHSSAPPHPAPAAEDAVANAARWRRRP
ncbi:IS30 family transposase, partial [Streptomyces goshikiensis]